MIIRDATRKDVAAMLAIYAPFITDTTVSFETEVPDEEAFAARVQASQQRHAWLVAEDDKRVIGYAYACPHRGRAAYRFACEVSVYVGDRAHGRGIGRALYEALFERLRAAGYYRAFGGITLPNDASVAFHRALGFDKVGVYQRVGYKFGEWRDVVWYGLSLAEGHPPEEAS